MLRRPSLVLAPLDFALRRIEGSHLTTAVDFCLFVRSLAVAEKEPGVALTLMASLLALRCAL